MKPRAAPIALAADDHPFDDGVRIGLEDGPVHEGPGIPLVAVADQILGRPWLFAAQGPLAAGREAGAAAAP